MSGFERPKSPKYNLGQGHDVELDVVNSENEANINHLLEVSSQMFLSKEELNEVCSVDLSILNPEQIKILFSNLLQVYHNFQNFAFGEVFETPSGSLSAEDVREGIYKLTQDPACPFFTSQEVLSHITPALEHSSVSLKRTYLQTWFPELLQDGLVVTGPGDSPNAEEYVSTLSDEEVHRLFAFFRMQNLDYLNWLQLLEYKEQYHEDSLTRDYRVFASTNATERETRKQQEMTIVGKASTAYGFIFGMHDQTLHFFPLDAKREEAQREHGQRFGEISEGHLTFVYSKLTTETDRTEALGWLVQFAPELPPHIVTQIEEQTSVVIPETFRKQKKMDRATFEETWAHHAENFESISSEELNLIIDILGDHWEERKNVAREKNYGFASENTDQISFFLSFIKQDPERMINLKQFSLLYYFYIRNNLPAKLVIEFERKFDIRVPTEFANILTLDDLLQTDPEELQSVLRQASGTRKEMADWLAERLILLNEQIEQAKEQVVLVDAGDVLSEEGFSVDKDKVRKYEYLMHPRLRMPLETQLGIDLKSLTIPVQLQFLSYIESHDNAAMEKIVAFAQQYGTNGMRTFLSLERGDETLGDAIVAFGERQELAEVVFRYYGELLDSADRAEELVREVTDCEENVCSELARQVRENILTRAQEDLERAVRADNPGDIEAQIENYVAAAKEYVALLQEVGSGHIEVVKASELSSDDVQAMRTLQRMRYERLYPGDEFADFRETVFASLEVSFSKSDTEFYILRDSEEIVCFNRFETRRDSSGREVTYFGSFNANSAYSGVGSVMLEESIRERLKDGRPMMAHCDPIQGISRKYIEDGFVATKLVDLSGHTDFEIWRSRDSERGIQSKQMSHTELLGMIGTDGDIVVREQRTSEDYQELQEGKALTRYFTHQGETYLVFETLPSTLNDIFVFSSAARTTEI